MVGGEENGWGWFSAQKKRRGGLDWIRLTKQTKPAVNQPNIYFITLI